MECGKESGISNKLGHEELIITRGAYPPAWKPQTISAAFCKVTISDAAKGNRFYGLEEIEMVTENSADGSPSNT